MISICEHIEYLINRHDCVVVPGWGAFIAQYQSAHYDANRGIMMPPVRSIGFNPSINHSDGLIATSVMRREAVSYNAAVQVVETEVDAMHHQLENDGELAVGRVGMFRKTADGAMEFEPFAKRVSQFMGLPIVSLTKKDEEKEAHEEEPRRKDIVYIPVSRNIFKVAASIILLICLGITLSTPIIVDEADVNYASISTPKVTIPEVETLQFTEPATDAELFIAIPEAADAIAEVDTTQQVFGNSVLRYNNDDAYCLVVASLATYELAEEYISERGDSGMHIMESNGKYRIYVATGATAAQAMIPTESEEFAAKYPAAWVCRR